MCRVKSMTVPALLCLFLLVVMFFVVGCENVPEEAVWHGIKLITDLDDGNPNDASIALSGNKVYISYCDFYKLKVAQSSDGGATFNLILVDSTSGVAYTNSITALGNNIYVSHQSFTDGKLKFAKSVDGGEAWSVYTGSLDPDNGTNGGGTSITAEGNSVFIGYYRDYFDVSIVVCLRTV